WARLIITVMRDDQGEPTALLYQAQDITDRKQAQADVRASEAEFRLLAETSTDMISRLDRDSNFLYVSHACQALLGYEPEELVGRNLHDMLHPDDAERVRQRQDPTGHSEGHTTQVYRI